jgi:uncharacterized protein YyaL (SSP411 family)
MPEGVVADLSDSRSPFLRHGSTQPVNWLAWSGSAFERARRENRPVLLDIGAIWCHWCHVMDRESYEDPETARLINDLYIPIKVDRDERPDIDARYQRAVQALTGHGGWPLTAFLTPSGEVFYGGTYFPPADRLGRPSFRRVLEEVARVWREDEARAVGAASEVSLHLSAVAEEEGEAGVVSATLVDAGIEAFRRQFDDLHGGFGGAPKFPNAGALHLLLDHFLDTGDDGARQMVARTLTSMARGGIHDQLGGGFHRYSVDARWLVPHFEKMAYDNGALVDIYSRAAAALGDEGAYRRVAEGVVAYYREVAPVLEAAGGYPASQDADFGPDDDGDYWTWTLAEVGEALGGDGQSVRAATLRYGLEDPASGIHSNRERHVLYQAAEVSEVAAALGLDEGAAESLLDQVERRLREARERRPRPYVDESLYTGWAALVASGHLAAARYLNIPGAGESALQALGRIWAEGFDAEDGVAHRVGAGEVGGYLEDQALFAQALLDAFEWTQRGEYIDQARRVMEVVLRRYVEPGSGAFADRPRGDAGAEGLLAEPYLPIIDAPSPSGNAVAAIVLLRLAALVEAPEYRQRAEAVLRAFAGMAAREPTAVATYLRAVSWATAPVTMVVVVGEAGDATAEALLRTALSTYRPRMVVRWVEAGATSAGVSASLPLPPELRAMLTGAVPRAYICVGHSCAAPVAEPGEMRRVLASFRG